MNYVAAIVLTLLLSAWTCNTLSAYRSNNLRFYVVTHNGW